MFKKSLALGIVSGLLAGIAGAVYARVYHQSLGADFSKVASTVRILAASLFGGVLAAIGYTLLDRWLKSRGEIVFNILFSLLSFATLLAPFAVKLPLDLETPELFPGMVIPMHFFPALAWFTLKPIFIRSK
jgi:ABC-type branched-subunit amino acid transport system permease subunit